MSARSVVQRPRSRIAPMPALSTTKTVHADGPPLGAAGATRPVARRRSCSHARCVPGSARRLASHRGVVHDEPRRLPRVARRPARTSCPSRRSAPTCTPSPSRHSRRTMVAWSAPSVGRASTDRSSATRSATPAPSARRASTPSPHRAQSCLAHLVGEPEQTTRRARPTSGASGPLGTARRAPGVVDAGAGLVEVVALVGGRRARARIETDREAAAAGRTSPDASASRCQ
jgi:hypothetical protein